MKMHHHTILPTWLPGDALPLLDDEVDNDIDTLGAMRFIDSDGSLLHDSHLPAEEFEELLYA